MGGIILFVVAIGLAAIGFVGFLLVKLINDGPGQEKRIEIDEAKVNQWKEAAAKHDPVKASDEAFMQSEAYANLKNLKAEIGKRVGLPIRERHTCGSLDEYKSFKAYGWILENLDAEEIKAHLERLDEIYQIYLDVRDDLDRACVMVCDEPDSKIQNSCWLIVDEILSMLPDGLPVAYTYSDPSAWKPYCNITIVPRDDLRRLAGMGPDPRSDLDGGLSAEKRHKILKLAGYRCSQCGRSPLSGGKLNIWTRDGGGADCLCDDCRRI